MSLVTQSCLRVTQIVEVQSLGGRMMSESSFAPTVSQTKM